MAKRFEKDSLYDELTGIYNRRYIDTWFNNQMKTILYDTQVISCSLFDLDYFKQVNDTYGHKAGDDVLLSFVDVVKSTLREGDLFARYGGEEFVVFSLLNVFDPPCAIAERTRKELESIETHGEIKLKVTCSAGVSSWSPKERDIAV